MKVLHILNSIMPSGAETMLVSSAECWEDCEKHTLATEEEVGLYADAMGQAGFVIHHIWNQSILMKHMKITRLIMKERFDVVHIHPQSQSILYSIDARLAGVRSIVRTVHSTFFFEGILKLRETLFRAIMRWLGVKFVAISDGVARNEEERFRNKTTIIYNWCASKYKFVTEEDKKEARELLNIPDNVFTILSVGNCADVKNHRMIFEAIHMLDDGKDLLYLHVGDHDEDEKRFALEKKIADNVKFVGKAIPDIYLQATDCYIMPSKYEGFGISALEAIISGLPVILTDVPGLRDFKDKEFDNVRFINLSSEELRTELIDIKEEKLQNSYQQSEKARKIYDMRTSVNRYLWLYRSGLKKVGLNRRDDKQRKQSRGK